MKSVTIDRSKRLNQEPHTGHNRWHPDIPAVVEVDEGEEVVLETRDAFDLQIDPDSTEADLDSIETGAIHALTGPVLVKDARPGDLLEVEFIDIVPKAWGFSGIMPGLGFLRDVFTETYIVHWNIADGWATSPQIPGVRVPGAPFMGLSGVAPSPAQLRLWAQREADVVARGGIAMLPDPRGAVPSSEPVASEGARTVPPRENGGNFDVKQLSKGARLLLPVAVDGALFSTGDAHFSQGDGEVCLMAVEMASTVSVRFKLYKGEASRHNIRWPRFRRDDYFTDPKWAAPQKFIATMGMPVTEDGVNKGENLNLAARNALLNMIDLIQERGFTREQAYVICSVGVDLKVSNVVDIPNYVVSAFLPEDLFH